MRLLVILLTFTLRNQAEYYRRHSVTSTHGVVVSTKHDDMESSCVLRCTLLRTTCVFDQGTCYCVQQRSGTTEDGVTVQFSISAVQYHRVNIINRKSFHTVFIGITGYLSKHFRGKIYKLCFRLFGRIISGFNMLIL